MTDVSLRAAILGFLDLEPTTGYSLRQRFDGSVASFWTVTQSQIYRELHALEAEGLVDVQREPGEGKPDRKIYSPTAAGRAALQAWLREPLDPVQLRHPLLLKFVFASEVEPEQLDALLAGYAEAVARTQAEYRARRSAVEIFSLARSEREAEIWKLSIDHGLAWCELETKWVARARARLGALPSAGTQRKAASKRRRS